MYLSRLSGSDSQAQKKQHAHTILTSMVPVSICKAELGHLESNSIVTRETIPFYVKSVNQNTLQSI